MDKYTEPQPIFLRWVDSSNLFQDRWARLEDLDQYEEETYCETLGFLVGESSHSLYIAGSLAPEEIGSVMQIPKGAIRGRSVVFFYEHEGEVIPLKPEL